MIEIKKKTETALGSMKKITYKKCPYCDSNNIEVINVELELGEDGRENKLTYYCVCKDCNKNHIEHFTNKPFSFKQQEINRRFYFESVEMENENDK